VNQSPSELEVVRERLAVVERALAQREERGLRLRRLASLAIAVVLFAAGGVAAANGNCPNGLPFCFAADTPAQASQVNHNFMQLKEWLETKVGPTSSSAITASGITTAGMTVNGSVQVNGDEGHNGRIIGTNGAGNFHLDTAATGNQAMYLNWFSGNNGVVFGNGGQAQVARIDGSGNLAVNGRINAGGSGGNVPNNCVVRSTSSSYNAACAAGEIAVGGGGRCASLYRLTESLPWGGPGEGDVPVNGAPPRAWRSVCQVWGSAGVYAVPQLGVYAVCCRY
jgi:hypothetical protein